MESNDRFREQLFRDRPHGEGWRWGIPERKRSRGLWLVAAVIAALAFAGAVPLIWAVWR